MSDAGIAKEATSISKAFHGGDGTGLAKVSEGIPLGSLSKDEPTTLVKQPRLDVSDEQVRYIYSPRVEYFKTSTGETESAAEYERVIARESDGRVTVIEPGTGKYRVLPSSDEFSRGMKNGYVLDFDVAGNYLNFEDRNPTLSYATAGISHAMALLDRQIPASQPAKIDIAQRTGALRQLVNNSLPLPAVKR